MSGKRTNPSPTAHCAGKNIPALYAWATLGTCLIVIKRFGSFINRTAAKIS